MRGEAEDLADAVAMGDFAGRASVAFDPLIEVAELDAVLDGDIYDGDARDVQSLGDFGNPLFVVKGSKCEGDGFIEGGGGDGVLDALQVFDGYAAGASGHEGRLVLSLYVRQ